jgi:hypothetical protein
MYISTIVRLAKADVMSFLDALEHTELCPIYLNKDNDNPYANTTTTNADVMSFLDALEHTELCTSHLFQKRQRQSLCQYYYYY